MLKQIPPGLFWIFRELINYVQQVDMDHQRRIYLNEIGLAMVKPQAAEPSATETHPTVCTADCTSTIGGTMGQRICERKKISMCSLPKEEKHKNKFFLCQMK